MAVCLHNDIQNTLAVAAPVKLSNREKECLLWTALGLSAKEIAQRLGITYRTVEFHLQGAKQKLSANNRVHTVAKAISLGLIRL
jgi:DNA-binding CsgD family transcriptional regulator